MFSAALVMEQRSSGLTLKQIAADIGMNYNTLRRKMSEYYRASRPIAIPAAMPLVREQPITIPTANCLVIGDLHVPHHNPEMLMRAIYVTRRFHPQVRGVVIGGDLFDFAELSQHPHDQPEAGTAATLRLGGEVMKALFQHFDWAVIVPGNHDQRLAKKLDKQLDLQLLVNAAMGRDWPRCKVQVTNLDYCYVQDDWLVGHPSHYSGLGGKTPSELADVWGRNVISFHNHVVGMSQSKTGQYLGIDAGHMTDPAQHYYQFRRMTKFARWTAGFVVLSNGFPCVYTERWTDWKSLGV